MRYALSFGLAGWIYSGLAAAANDRDGSGAVQEQLRIGLSAAGRRPPGFPFLSPAAEIRFGRCFGAIRVHLSMNPDFTDAPEMSADCCIHGPHLA